MHARIATVNKRYCHAVLVDGGDSVFVHQTACDFRVAEARPGDLVDVGAVDDEPRGLRGYDVRWLDRTVGTGVHPFEGVVVHLARDRRFGFLRPVDTDLESNDVMFQAKDFADYDGRSATFDALVIGDRVRGIYHITSRGRRGARLQGARYGD